MNEKMTAQLHDMFGSLWEELMKCSDCVGAFVLWHDSREFYIDDNALELLCMDREKLSYEALSNVVECARDADGSSSPAKVVTLYENTDESCTPGFVIKRETVLPRDMEEIFPLLTQTQLAERMGEAGSDAFLMLVQLEHADGGRDERAFVRSALENIDKNCPVGSALAYNSGYKFWVFVRSGVTEPQEFAEKLQRAVKECTITDEFGVMISKDHSMTFTGGYVSFNGVDQSAVKELHYASFALYEAVNEGAGTISSFSSALYELQKNDYRKVKDFFRVLDENSFMYHFQPIVSAKDGSIVAYEALMRTDRKFGLSPMQIIDMAAKYDRLYDIEHATMFNVLHQLSRNQSFFKQRKLFINAIPSSFLSYEDWSRLLEEYGELMEKVVIELTEQTDTPEDKLDILINRLREHKVEMAIDDYGTGYSNTSRLIRYDPKYIKLDHSLISGIDTNLKLRNIVSQLIEMMHSNGHLVLAEGVETSEELQVLADIHADLFQGFYISRPKPFFISEIGEKVRSEIIRYHLEAHDDRKIYHACSEEHEALDLTALVRDNYTGIYISGSSVEISGGTDLTSVTMPITIQEDNKCSLTLKNVFLQSDNDRSVIDLGSGSKLTLTVVGTNRLSKGGILVPSNSELTLEGPGRLEILSENICSFGIGNDFELSYGKIELRLTGELDMTTCGNKCVGIGGGRQGKGGGINVLAGAVSINCSGSQSIGIGSVSHNTSVALKECRVSIEASSADFVGVGSFTGNTEMAVNNVKLDIEATGNTMCAFGSKDGGKADIDIKNCELNSKIRGREIVNLGSHGSICKCRVANSAIALDCEGNHVSGIGDSEGGGRVDINDSEININFMTSAAFTIGCRDGELNFNGGTRNIRINE